MKDFRGSGCSIADPANAGCCVANGATFWGSQKSMLAAVCEYSRSSVYDVLALRRFVVTLPSPINVSRKTHTIIPTHGVCDVKTNFARELVGE